jgi:membrane protein YdbS with pleckstrin-like domain
MGIVQTTGPENTGPERDRSDSDGEVWRTPSPALRSVRMAQLLAVSLPAVVLSVALGLVFGASLAGSVAAAAVVAAAAMVAVVTGRRRRAWGFVERTDDLMVRRGVIFRRVSVIPYGRMQYVDVTAGPFERLFGLATVRMHTAAAASDARIPGLPLEDASALRDRLSRLGESRLAGL